MADRFLSEPVVTSIIWPSARVTMALLDVALATADAAEALDLALAVQRVDRLTLTLNSASTAALICGLVASAATMKTTWLCSDAAVDFSVMTGRRITS